MSAQDDAQIEANSRRLYRDRNCPDLHLPVSRENIEWLAREAEPADAIIGVERVRRENSTMYAAVMEAAGDAVLRGVLATLVRRPQVTYTELEQAVAKGSRRTIKRRVWRLRDADVVQVTDAQPAVVSLANPRAETLATDVLHHLVM